MLRTARLQLRPHTPEDLDDRFALWSHPTTVRYIGGSPLNREDVWSRLLRSLGHWQALGFGYFVVHHHQRFLGEVGVADFRRENQHLPGAGEVGWILHPDVHGQGYALEAVTAVLDWFARPTGCIIHPDNQASLKLAAKLDFQCSVTLGIQPSLAGRNTENFTSYTFGTSVSF